MLMDSFREVVSKEKIGEENYHTPHYSTGFDIFDYRNGRIESNQPILGVDGGRILTAIGKSGSGKTTFIVQLAKNIVENYENGQIIHLDYERAMTRARIESLTGWSPETIKNKYMLLNRGITSESLYKMCKSIANLKLDPKNYDTLKIATDKVDNNGNVVYELPPTVVIVDSWAVMVPKDISEEEELSGSMSASSIAKTNNAIIKRLTGTLEQANILLCIINHITQKIEIGSNRLPIFKHSFNCWKLL